MELNSFQKLCVLRCVRPDKTMDAMQKFVVEKLGKVSGEHDSLLEEEHRSLTAAFVVLLLFRLLAAPTLGVH